MPLETWLFLVGFFLIFIFLADDFPQFLKRLQALVQQRPRLKYLAYPLGALLGLAAAALMV